MMFILVIICLPPFINRVGFILLLLLSTSSQMHAQHTKPDHLVPIPAYNSNSYDQAVFNTLIGNGSAELWMVCKPSFSSEYALTLRSELANPNAKDPYSSEEPRTWILEVVTAVVPIWHWKSNPDGSESLDIRKDVSVKRERMTVDESLVKAIRRAWEPILRRTYYSAENNAGLDGTIYQFYCRDNLFGQVWSPEKGLPKDLAELSDRLVKLVQSSGELRPMLSRDCLLAAQQLANAAR